MDWWSWVFLGVLQGLTEFLPVSSSGHLVLAQSLLGLETPGILLEITVHVATAAAVAVLFFRELAGMVGAVLRWPLRTRPGSRGRDDARWRRMFLNLLLATAVTAVVGFSLEPLFRGAFERPMVAAGMLLVTGTVLFLSARFRPGSRGLAQIRPTDAALVGVAQGLAILPGLSRSGLTIVGGLSRGLEAETAARFSFLLSLPAIAGAALVELVRFDGLGTVLGGGLPVGGLLVAFAAAFLSGLAAMVLLTRLIRRGKFHRFAWYCWFVGAAALVWLGRL